MERFAAMHPDLQQLIDLQGLDRDLDALRHAIDAVPQRREAIETRVACEAEAVAAAKQRVSDNRAARQVIEKDLQLQQGRLSKFRDQLMAVKTNKEYQAMQVEIATAEGEVRRLEDQLLERMMEADEAAAALKQAEATHAADRADSAHGWVSFRHGGETAVVAWLDGHVSREGYAALRDMRLWAEPARRDDNPAWRRP